MDGVLPWEPWIGDARTAVDALVQRPACHVRQLFEASVRVVDHPGSTKAPPLGGALDVVSDFVGLHCQSPCEKTGTDPDGQQVPVRVMNQTEKPATRLASGTRVRVVIARLVMRAIQTG